MRIRLASFAAGLLAVPAVAVAQQVELPPVRYPLLPGSARDAAGFVPAGWRLLASRRGDLNGDGALDLALLLRMHDPANIVNVPSGGRSEPFDTNPHMLAIAFADRRGGYRLAASNRGLFPRPTRPWTGEDPPGEDTLRIERRTLVVHLGYLRGWARFRFRWQGGDMQLIGYDRGGASGGCVSTMSLNYLTGRAKLETGPISSDRTRVVWRRLRNTGLERLVAIDLDRFDPDAAIVGPPLPCPASGDD